MLEDQRGLSARDIGYGVPSTCDHPGCGKQLNRGLSYVCGGEPYGGEHGCGLFFCGEHMHHEDRGEECPQLCERCAAEQEPFEPTPDTAEWVEWKLTDESWGQWRAENPEEVAAMKALFPATSDVDESGSERAPASTGMTPNPLSESPSK